MKNTLNLFVFLWCSGDPSSLGNVLILIRFFLFRDLYGSWIDTLTFSGVPHIPDLHKINYNVHKSVKEHADSGRQKCDKFTVSNCLPRHPLAMVQQWEDDEALNTLGGYDEGLRSQRASKSWFRRHLLPAVHVTA